MSNDVMDAYSQLVNTAGLGNQFRYDQVLFPPYPGENQGDAIYGTGFDFDFEISVPDIVDGETVQAAVKLRVIKTADGDLYLRNWLIWTPSDGYEHKSFASYTISPEAAEQLAASTPSAESSMTEEEFNLLPPGEQLQAAFSMIFESMDDSEPYKANWIQTIPDLDDLQAATAHDCYHGNVIIGLGGTDNAPTCMLSDMDLGEVGPGEIIAIAYWVAENLDAGLLDH